MAKKKENGAVEAKKEVKTEVVELNDIKNLENTKLSPAEQFVANVKKIIKNVRTNYFEIGYELWKARENKLYSKLGYSTIEGAAEKLFDIGKSTAYDMMNVFDRFCVKEKCGFAIEYKNEIDDIYADYGFSQLVELDKMGLIPQPVQKYIPSTSSVRDIAAYRKYFDGRNASTSLPLPEWKEKIQKPALKAAKAEQIKITLPAQTSKKVENAITDSKPSYMQPETETKTDEEKTEKKYNEPYKGVRTCDFKRIAIAYFKRKGYDIKDEDITFLINQVLYEYGTFLNMKMDRNDYITQGLLKSGLIYGDLFE